MANNRLFLVDKETGEKVTVLKYYPSTGWFVNLHSLSAVVEFLDKYDERAKSSMNGNFFTTEFEESDDGA